MSSRGHAPTLSSEYTSVGSTLLESWSIWYKHTLQASSACSHYCSCPFSMRDQPAIFHSEIHSFNKYWLSSWNIPGILIISGDTLVSKKETISFFPERLIQQGRHAVSWGSMLLALVQELGALWWQHMADTPNITSKQGYLPTGHSAPVGSLHAKWANFLLVVFGYSSLGFQQNCSWKGYFKV